MLKVKTFDSEQMGQICCLNMKSYHFKNGVILGICWILIFLPWESAHFFQGVTLMIFGGLE